MNKKLNIFCVLFLLPVLVVAQNFSDHHYFQQGGEGSFYYQDNHKRIPKGDYQNKKWNPVNFFLNIYKTVISEQMSTGCVYEITCSDFMRLAVQRYGLLKGTFLGLDRLTRCNSLSLKDVPNYKVHPNTRLIYDEPKAYAL
ncbi:MAG: membrane protein insertion efficiency factor YidD [Bacteroidales bacterium]